MAVVKTPTIISNNPVYLPQRYAFYKTITNKPRVALYLHYSFSHFTLDLVSSTRIVQSVAHCGRADHISDCKSSLNQVPLVFVRFNTDLNIF